MSDFLEFLWAVVNSWAGYATGGLIVASCWLFFTWRDKPMPKKIGFTLATGFLFMAFYRAWKDQKDNGETQAQRVTALKGQVEALTKSNVSGEIVFAVLGAQTTGSHAGLVVNLRNQGAPSAIDPSTFGLEVETLDGRKFQGNPTTLEDKNLDFCFGPERFIRFVRSDGLDLKTSERPLDRNGFVQGFLWFVMPSLDRELLVNPGTTITLYAKTITGQDVRVHDKIRELIDKSQHTSFFPGITNPRPIVGPCKENAPY